MNFYRPLLLLCAGICLFSLTACPPKDVGCVDQTDSLSTQNRSANLPQNLKIFVNKGGFNITLTKGLLEGQPPQVNVTAAANVQNNITVDGYNSTLFIEQTTCINGPKPQLSVVCYGWTSLINQGTGNLTTTNQQRVGNTIQNTGSGNVVADVLAFNGLLTVQNYGTGNVTVTGQASSISVNSSSSGVVEATGLPVNLATVALSGKTGKIRLTVNGNVTGYLSGGDSLFLSGSPTNSVVLRPGATGAVVLVQ
jgi:hypothetical protein